MGASVRLSKRNGEIDLLRFVFILIIVIFHFSNTAKLGLFKNGYIGVDFFFVLSGFLMARHVSINHSDNMDLVNIADGTWYYLLHKVKSFYTYYFSAILYQVVFRFIIIERVSPVKIGYSFLKSIPTFSLLFLEFNEVKGLYVGNTWYLSAMLIAIFILYPFLLRNFCFSTKIVFPVVALFILGYMVATNHSLSMWAEWSGFTYFGVLRGVSEMALGGCLLQLSEVVTTRHSKLLYPTKRMARIILTCFKTFCFLIVLIFARGSIGGVEFEQVFGIHALLFCALGILFSFSNVGYCIPDSRITRFLGKISLPIFIYHGVIRSIVRDDIQNLVSTEMFMVIIFLCILLCVLLMYITDFIAKKLKIFFVSTWI